MRRKLLRWQWIALAVVLTVGLAGALRVSRSSSHAVAAKETEQPAKGAEEYRVVRVDVVPPTAGGIERETTQPGSVIAYESAELFAKVSGYLKTQSVDIGSRVQQGEVLAEIDAPEFSKAVDQGQAAVDQSEAQVLQARRSHRNRSGSARCFTGGRQAGGGRNRSRGSRAFLPSKTVRSHQESV